LIEPPLLTEFVVFFDGFGIFLVAIHQGVVLIPTDSEFCEFEFTLFPTKKIGKGMVYEQLFTVISNRIYEDLFKDNDVVKGTRGR